LGSLAPAGVGVRGISVGSGYFFTNE